jgi:hypothetical protein
MPEDGGGGKRGNPPPAENVACSTFNIEQSTFNIQRSTSNQRIRARPGAVKEEDQPPITPISRIRGTFDRTMILVQGARQVGPSGK